VTGGAAIEWEAGSQLQTSLEYYEQRERALDYTRQRWRERVGVGRTISVVLGAIMLGGWWAQDPSAGEPLSINFNGEQAIAVVGLALLIFGMGAWCGRICRPSHQSGLNGRLRTSSKRRRRIDARWMPGTPHCRAGGPQKPRV
jgi:hypothetical protein